MSRVETPSSIKIEGIGGSFSRNVQMDEHGLGMRYDQPGEVFDLATVWRNPVNAGTIIAPGMFRYIYIREAFKRGDSFITRISPDGTTHRVSMQSDWGGHFIKQGRVEDLLANPKYARIEIADQSELTDDETRPVEVVRRVWGIFDSQDQIYSSKMRQLYEKDVHIPQVTVEEEFNTAFSAGYAEFRAKEDIGPIKILDLHDKESKKAAGNEARPRIRRRKRTVFINTKHFFSRS